MTRVQQQKLSYKTIFKTLRQNKQILKTSFTDIPDKRGALRTKASLIQKEDIFLAYQGVTDDGHHFIPEATSRDAGLIIQDSLTPAPSTPFILVKNSRHAWSLLEAASHNNPQDDLKFIGITGTNGKTSTAWIAHALLARCNLKSMYIGTLGVFDHNSQQIKAPQHTTPDPDCLFDILAYAVKQEYNVIILEVSSHALVQKKLGPIKFTAACFTNFSRDHLDFHKSMKNYWSANIFLFANHLKEDALCVIHQSLKRKISNPNCIFYKQKDAQRTEQPTIQRKNNEQTPCSTITLAHHNKIITGKIPYLSTHNRENFEAAFRLSLRLNTAVLNPKHWLTLPQIPGRLELINTKETAPHIIIDYAHTPDALKKLLHFANYQRTTNGLIYLLFGCGGNRDQGKRRLMGKIAEDHSDKVILTSDNPRNEDPNKIIAGISADLKNPHKITTIIDREKAIAYAIKEAQPKDLLLIAGKGHETHQQLGTKKVPFQDKAIIIKHLKRQGLYQ